MKRLLVVLLLATIATPQEEYTRTADVIYGRKDGLALTMDIFKPKQDANGAGVVFVVSSGWWSSKRMIRPPRYIELLRRGITVFAVTHGSQPKYSIPEMVGDVHRAVRYVRFNAKKFGVDKNRIGIMGMSAGGHLSLLIATSGGPAPGARDDVDRETSRVQAVAALFPPTDFVNYGAEGMSVYDLPVREQFRAPFDFKRFDRETRTFVKITKREEIQKKLKEVSPAHHVSADDPPTLLVHGDRDRLVPLQQSRLMVKKLTKAGVQAELIVKEGKGHGWRGVSADLATMASWFNRWLAPRAKK